MPRSAEHAAGRLSRAGRGLLWLVFSLGLLAASLLASWHAWAAVDFGYRYWHGAIGIDATIERYGPQNRFRRGFETTTPDERARLFGAIVDAIQWHPGALPHLRYHAPDGRALGRLLRPPEIRHLRDVSALVGAFRAAGIVGALAALTIAALAIVRRWPLPRPAAFTAGAAVLAAAAGLVLAAFGPTDVFYALHVWIFPADHQWFFTYQESLMSMMMRAPVLFGAIAAEWAASAVLLFALLLAAQRALHRRLTADAS